MLVEEPPATTSPSHESESRIDRFERVIGARTVLGKLATSDMCLFHIVPSSTQPSHDRLNRKSHNEPCFFVGALEIRAL